MILKNLQKFKVKGSFIRNISISSFWNGAIVATQFCLSPIIARIFGPTEYGVFAIFNSIVINVSLIGTLKYADAIVLTNNQEQRNNLSLLTLLIVLTVSLFTFLLIAIGLDPLANFFKITHTPNILFLIPCSVFLAGVIEIITCLNITRKKFALNGLAGFTLNFTSRGFNVLYGLFILTNSIGLILGEIVGKVFTLLILVFSIRNLRNTWYHFWDRINLQKMKDVAVRFKSFPIYFLPSTLLIYFSGHLPLFFFQWEYGAMVLGSYALASSLLEIFNKVIPYAMAPAVLQKMNELKDASLGNLKIQSFRLFRYLMAVSFFIFVPILLFSETAFQLAFGDKWIKAGTFASLLTVHYAFNFVGVAISELYNVLHRQKFLLLNSIVTILLRIVSLILMNTFHLSDVQALFLFSVVSSVGSIFLILGIFQLLKYKIVEVSLILFSVFSILSLMVYLVVFQF